MPYNLIVLIAVYDEYCDYTQPTNFGHQAVYHVYPTKKPRCCWRLTPDFPKSHATPGYASNADDNYSKNDFKRFVQGKNS